MKRIRPGLAKPTDARFNIFSPKTKTSPCHEPAEVDVAGKGA
jgi:hypothetical protein